MLHLEFYEFFYFNITVAVTVDPRFELVHHGVLDADLDTQVTGSWHSGTCIVARKSSLGCISCSDDEEEAAAAIASIPGHPAPSTS